MRMTFDLRCLQHEFGRIHSHGVDSHNRDSKPCTCMLGAVVSILDAQRCQTCTVAALHVTNNRTPSLKNQLIVLLYHLK